MWSFDGVREEDRIIYQKVLENALRSKPTPSQPGYEVKGAAVTLSGIIIDNEIGSNHEYAIQRAGHCEEALTFRALDDLGEDDPITVLGIVAGQEGNIATPCGNCRDVLRKYAHSDVVIISGSPEGGKAVAMPLSSYLFSDYGQVDDIKEFDWEAAEFARSVETPKSKLLYVKHQGQNVYGAATVTKAGIFIAGFEQDVSYHPSYPIRNSLIRLKWDFNSRKERFDVEYIVVATTSSVPDVPYLERQHLTEFEDLTRTIRGKSPIPVFLLELNDDGSLSKVLKTDSSKWLPHPFSPGNLGMEMELRESLETFLR